MCMCVHVHACVYTYACNTFVWKSNDNAMEFVLFFNLFIKKLLLVWVFCLLVHLYSLQHTCVPLTLEQQVSLPAGPFFWLGDSLNEINYILNKCGRSSYRRR